MDIAIDIRKAFPDFLLDVSLHTSSGRLGLLGASGAGKSMLLRCVSGLVRPDQGKIVIGGKVLFNAQQGINLQPRDRRIGFIFQNYALFPHMTVQQNITFGLEGLPDQLKAESAARLLERFHLHDIGNRYPSQISGGQQQRVAIARALAIEPEILLLDEPLSALDEHLRGHMIQEMLEDLKDFKGSVLLVTHNLDEAYRMCSDLAIMHRGRIESLGPKDWLFKHPQTIESARITGCKNIAGATWEADQRIRVPAWGVSLKTASGPGATQGYGGIRAHHIRLAQPHRTDNAFKAWIADHCETSTRITLYLKIDAKPETAGDYTLQYETTPEHWQVIQTLEQPFGIELPPEHVFFVSR